MEYNIPTKQSKASIKTVYNSLIYFKHSIVVWKWVVDWKIIHRIILRITKLVYLQNANVGKWTYVCIPNICAVSTFIKVLSKITNTCGRALMNFKLDWYLSWTC